MTNRSDTISRTQLTALAFVGLLSPTVRRIPGQLSLEAGRACWVSVLFAAVPLVIMALLYAALRKRAGSLGGEELVLGALGAGAGRFVLGATGLWLIFYCSYHLCTGADRFISTIFPNMRPVFLILVMLAMCLIAALGEVRALARSAMLFRPVLLLVLIVLAVFALPDVDFSELTPPFENGAVPAFRGVLQLMNIASITFYLSFLEDHTQESFSAGRFITWALTYVMILLFLCIAVPGLLGLELTQNLAHPFFTIIRELTLFSSVERLEAIIIGLWVFPDFILTSVLLKIASKLLARALGLSAPKAEGERFFSLRGSRWLVWLCWALAGAGTLVIGGNSFRIMHLSKDLFPALNFTFSLALLPLCFFIWYVKSCRTSK